MLKQVLALLSLILSFASPAFAQNAGEIARVQAGQSCPGCNLFQADLAYYDADGIDVSGSRLRQSDMQLGTFDNWNLRGANLYGASLVEADLRLAIFRTQSSS